MKNRSEIDKEQLWMDIIGVLPLIIVVGIIPLLVGIRIIDLSMVEQVLYSTEDQVDFFNKLKSQWLLLAAGLALVFGAIGIATKKVKLCRNQFMILVLSYILLVLISTILARYRSAFQLQYIDVIANSAEIAAATNLGWLGYLNRYEGFFVLTSYVVLGIYSFGVLNSLRRINLVVNTALFTGAVMGIISALQFVGFNLLEKKPLIDMILGPSYAGMKESVHFIVDSRYAIGTLNNPNYLGGYMALLLPLALALLAFSIGKRYTIFYTIVTVLIYTGLLTSNSSTGILGAIGAVIIVVGLCYRVLWEKKRLTIGILMAAILILALLNGVSQGRIDGEFNSLRQNLSEDSKETVFEELVALEEIPSGLRIRSTRTELTIILSSNKLNFYDSDGDELEYKVYDSRIQLEDEFYEGWEIKFIEGNAGLSVRISGKQLYLQFLPDRIGVVGSGLHVYPTNREIARFGFENHQGLASNRGYIWSRTLPLIKDYLLIGAGPDTYAAVFPQYDLIGKVNILGTSVTTVDKPHNIYMQTAINTGFLSLIILVWMIVICVIKLLQTLNKSKELMVKGLLIGLVAALVSFGITGMANDSVITITSIVWILVGAGYRYIESEGEGGEW